MTLNLWWHRYDAVFAKMSSI